MSDNPRKNITEYTMPFCYKHAKVYRPQSMRQVSPARELNRLKDCITKLQTELAANDKRIAKLEIALNSEITNTALAEVKLEEAEQRIEELDARYTILADALSEIKATNDGNSEQSITTILDWCITELKGG